jgi:hypothetical protein
MPCQLPPMPLAPHVYVSALATAPCDAAVEHVSAIAVGSAEEAAKHFDAAAGICLERYVAARAVPSRLVAATGIVLAVCECVGTDAVGFDGSAESFDEDVARLVVGADCLGVRADRADPGVKIRMAVDVDVRAELREKGNFTPERSRSRQGCVAVDSDVALDCANHDIVIQRPERDVALEPERSIIGAGFNHGVGDRIDRRQESAPADQDAGITVGAEGVKIFVSSRFIRVTARRPA